MRSERKNKKKTVLILCPSPFGTAAAQRLKYEQYLSALEKEGYSFTISNFQTKRFWSIVHKEGRILEKMFWVVFGYGKRIFDLLRAPFFDGIFVTIWGTPLGWPIYENSLFLFNNNVIYDLDDMMFLDKVEHAKSKWLEKIKGKRKPIVLMKKAKYVIVCTPKLEEIALGLNKYKRVIDISSTFDTDRFVPVKEYEKHEITTLGWTGTHSTIPFLETLQPVLAELSKKLKIKLLVIANREYYMKDVDTEFIFWKKESEVKDLQSIEIGLYPIPANEWSLGKSSLKALTYMAIGVPFVATAYGTNYRIMENGIQGFLASTDQEWLESLTKLVNNVSLRRTMGIEGRKRVEQMFSVKANFPKYQEVFRTVLQGKYRR
jgi:glycosyltransferase involved in cell wall biosynthesis